MHSFLSVVALFLGTSVCLPAQSAPTLPAYQQSQPCTHLSASVVLDLRYDCLECLGDLIARANSLLPRAHPPFEHGPHVALPLPLVLYRLLHLSNHAALIRITHRLRDVDPESLHP